MGLTGLTSRRWIWADEMALSDCIVKDLAAGLRKIFDGNISQIILFGPSARMDDLPESDIDIAVIIRQEISFDKRQEFLEGSAKFDMKYEKVFSFVDIEEEKMKKWGGDSAIL